MTMGPHVRKRRCATSSTHRMEAPHTGNGGATREVARVRCKRESEAGMRARRRAWRSERAAGGRAWGCGRRDALRACSEETEAVVSGRRRAGGTRVHGSSRGARRREGSCCACGWRREDTGGAVTRAGEARPASSPAGARQGVARVGRGIRGRGLALVRRSRRAWWLSHGRAASAGTGP